MSAEPEVHADIHPLLEFPAIAYAIGGEESVGVNLAEMVEHCSQSRPHHDAVAAPYMLTHLDGHVGFLLGAVATLVVSAYAVGVVDGGK